jgi:hypothetical protein
MMSVMYRPFSASRRPSWRREFRARILDVIHERRLIPGDAGCLGMLAGRGPGNEKNSRVLAPGAVPRPFNDRET